MGQPKLSLPVAGRTVLEWVIAAFQQAQVTEILVILAPHTAALAALADRCGAKTLLLPAATPDMRATIQAGLDYLEQQYHPAATDRWFLLPADHPTLDAALVRSLLQAAAAEPAATILLPTFQGRRGHPVLLRWSHVPAIRQWPLQQGLNSYLRQKWEETYELPVSSAAILWDLDTPDDYERLLRLFTADGTEGS